MRAPLALLVGFDSAWTAKRSGALVGVLKLEGGAYEALGSPKPADFIDAEKTIREWQAHHKPQSTVVLLDQPTIVANTSGQRPVEGIVSAAVSRRRGGVQPANTGRVGMFCGGAPIWRFLAAFGGAVDPERFCTFRCDSLTHVIETYPVLTIVALGWLLPDSRSRGRLPKYNPERRRTFALEDWLHVCSNAAKAIEEFGLAPVGQWLRAQEANGLPRKEDQDCLDACLCLLVGLHLVEGRRCSVIGNRDTGDMVVPYSADLEVELAARCKEIERSPDAWVRSLTVQ